MKHSELVVGEHYTFWQKLEPISRVGDSPAIPGGRVTRVGQLIEKRSGGKLVVAWGRWDWDRRLDEKNKQAVRRTRLVEIRTCQIVDRAAAPKREKRAA